MKNTLNSNNVVVAIPRPIGTLGIFFVIVLHDNMLTTDLNVSPFSDDVISNSYIISKV